MLNQLSTISVLPLRLAIGVIMFAHGAQKLLGWFGGPGFQETANMFQTGLGLSPGWLHAALGGGGELLGGLLLFFGLFTRFGAFLVAATMVVAIFKVHLSGGLFASNNGFEYPLTLLAGAMTLMITGGQGLALEQILKIQLHTPHKS